MYSAFYIEYSSFVCSFDFIRLSFFFFFFTRRRRHTRSVRDWSSDVCSSDLPAPLWISFSRCWISSPCTDSVPSDNLKPLYSDGLCEPVIWIPPMTGRLCRLQYNRGVG